MQQNVNAGSATTTSPFAQTGGKENLRDNAFSDLSSLDEQADSDAAISPEEMDILDNLETSPGSDDEKRVHLDDTDEDGEQLNESSDTGGAENDLDIPGAELDDADEEIGEEDEENNFYSQADAD